MSILNPEADPTAVPAPTGVGQVVQDLLHDPEEVARRLSRSPAPALAWPGLAAASLVAYGLAAGTFQGGLTLILAALKTPLIVMGSVALCAPSLIVFRTLWGSRVSLRGYGVALGGFTLVLSLVMAGLVPVTWLFSASSKSLAFAVSFHLVIWVVALVLAGRHLGLLLRGSGGQSSNGLWLVLLFVVSLQTATSLRPVLERAPGAPLVEAGKLSFLEHVSRIFSAD